MRRASSAQARAIPGCSRVVWLHQLDELTRSCLHLQCTALVLELLDLKDGRVAHLAGEPAGHLKVIRADLPRSAPERTVFEGHK